MDSMKIDRRAALAALASLPVLTGAAQAKTITIFEARRFITMEPARPTCRYVAVADGLIVALGDSLAELSAWTHGRTIKIDKSLAGQVVMPGLIDPHLHPMQASIMLNLPFIAPDDWDLPTGKSHGVRDQAGYRARLAAAIKASDASTFITWGYHELFHGHLGRRELDAMAPGRAVIIWQRSFHEIIVSTAVLEQWGVATPESFAALLKAGHADPAHGDFERGMFTETGLQAAVGKMQPLLLGPGKIARGMALLQQTMQRRGVTTTSDMATGVFANFDTEAGLIRAAFERSDAMARVQLMPMAARLDLVEDLDGWMQAARRQFAGPKVRLARRVKMLADGAFFALNMRMNAPGYTDGHEGKWLTEPAVLTRQFARYWNAGFSLHIHVNGDEGLDRVLEGLVPLAARTNQTITLEHLGYSTEAQHRRIARMGLMVSAQPNYIRVLGDAYGREGLGAGRAEQINRLGSLERLGVPLGLHSDFNMAPIDPFYLAWIAANRMTIEGQVKAPAERLSLDKALRAITIEAAQVIGMDAEVGSIAVGKRADFVGLSHDPHALGAARLREMGITGVVFEGRYQPN